MAIPLSALKSISSQSYRNSLVSCNDVLEALSACRDLNTLLLPQLQDDGSVAFSPYDDSSPQRFLIDYQLALHRLTSSVLRQISDGISQLSVLALQRYVDTLLPSSAESSSILDVLSPLRPLRAPASLPVSELGQPPPPPVPFTNSERQCLSVCAGLASTSLQVVLSSLAERRESSSDDAASDFLVSFAEGLLSRCLALCIKHYMCPLPSFDLPVHQSRLSHLFSTSLSILTSLMPISGFSSSSSQGVDCTLFPTSTPRLLSLLLSSLPSLLHAPLLAGPAVDSVTPPTLPLVRAVLCSVTPILSALLRICELSLPEDCLPYSIFETLIAPLLPTPSFTPSLHARSVGCGLLVLLLPSLFPLNSDGGLRCDDFGGLSSGSFLLSKVWDASLQALSTYESASSSTTRNADGVGAKATKGGKWVTDSHAMLVGGRRGQQAAIKGPSGTQASSDSSAQAAEDDDGEDGRKPANETFDDNGAAAADEDDDGINLPRVELYPPEQVLRRRGVRLLGQVSDLCKCIADHQLKADPSSAAFAAAAKLAADWCLYVQCFEVLEMESQEHIVDQVFSTVSKLTSSRCLGAVVPSDADAGGITTPNIYLPQMSFSRIATLLSRAMYSESPSVRKLTIFRFLTDSCGVSACSRFVREDDASLTVGRKSAKDWEKTKATVTTKNIIYGEGKEKGGKKKKATDEPPSLAPIHVVTPSFIIDVLVPSLDSLRNQGTIYQTLLDGKVHCVDLSIGVSTFISSYIEAVASLSSSSPSAPLPVVFDELFAVPNIQGLQLKTIVLLFQACAPNSSESKSLPISRETIIALTSYLKIELSAAPTIRLKECLQSFSSLLQRVTIVTSGTGAAPTRSNLNPAEVLYVLSVFSYLPSIESDISFALAQFLASLPNNFAVHATSAISSAFVLGDTSSSVPSQLTISAQEQSKAISLLAVLTTSSANPEGGGAALWPSIFRGLNAPNKSFGSAKDRAFRALQLLVDGCERGILGGSGNGVLLQSEKGNKDMMPPPPQIEALLFEAASMLKSVLQTADFSRDEGLVNSTIDQTSGKVDYIERISQMMLILKGAFPNSNVIEAIIKSMMEEAVNALQGDVELQGMEATRHLTILRCGLKCSAYLDSTNTGVGAAYEKLLKYRFVSDASSSSSAEQGARTAFHVAKWGCMSLMTKEVFDSSSSSIDSVALEHASSSAKYVLDEVYNCPLDAVTSLFEVAVVIARFITIKSSSYGGIDADTCEMLVNGLWSFIEEEPKASKRIAMTNHFCSIIFSREVIVRPELNKKSGPVQKILATMLEQSKVFKPLVGRAAAAYLFSSLKDGCGENAIAYRDTIFELLLNKEVKLTTFMRANPLAEDADITKLDDEVFGASKKLEPPKYTQESSMTRACALLFVEWLPSPTNGMTQDVLTELPHYLIFKLLKLNMESKYAVATMIGTHEYCRKLRSWQALCALSRFVTEDVAGEVADSFFKALKFFTHGSIRYYMECFGLTCLFKMPRIFGPKLLEIFDHRDLSSQAQSSLLTMVGKALLGEQRKSFTAHVPVKHVLAAICAWLGSTQGFNRAASQLIAHALIPEFLKESKDSAEGGFFIAKIFEFLETNADMAKLRQKQAKFFQTFEFSDACSVSGILGVSHDDQEDPMPPNLIESLKNCLVELFNECHSDNDPEWKVEARLKEEAEKLAGPSGQEASSDLESTNFQRKIMPLDSLHLVEKAVIVDKLSNAAGTLKQHLIICASLIDKPPNLAGLARTAEIFAAESLVIPDIKVKKMDVFKSISVSAHEWVDIYECGEKDLRSYLISKKKAGYSIVGLEQTFDSIEMSSFTFPEKTVLLLGDERKGIPVDLLEVVDHCIEIPQFGITRSLNVHVTGALAIWEYTKQNMKLGK